MSEIKVNKIQSAAGDRIVVAAPIQGADAPSDCPDCLATLRQVGGGGSVGASQAYVDERDDATLLAAKQYSDEQNELQNNQLTLDINAAKDEAINSANAHSDANDFNTLLSANAYTDSKVYSAESDAKIIPIGGIVMTGSANGDGNGLDDGDGGTIVSNSIGPGYEVFAITYCENCGNNKLGSRYYHGKRTTENISADTPGGYTDTPVVISGVFLCRGVAERTGVNMVSYLWQRIS